MTFFKFADEQHQQSSALLESYRRTRDEMLNMGFILRTNEPFDNVQAQTAELNALLITAEPLLNDFWVQIGKLIKFPVSDRSDMYISFEKRCLRTLEANLCESAALADVTLTHCARLSNSCRIFLINGIIY
ncbi:hypothetical protein NPIL_82011 [Nephila pilipes]|uniref:Uncharacterized protein n=1 Tax=Nephila pilipes TaxID=299642 RepID=A0A8X6QAD3_NEPPI|nr:hypothetical protein NPIL_82011 [Nephila pilipes]